MCVFKEVLLITVQTWLWLHYVKDRNQAQTVTSNIIFCQEYQSEAFIDVYVAELNIALTKNCAANKAYNFRFTKDNLNYGNKM